MSDALRHTHGIESGTGKIVTANDNSLNVNEFKKFQVLYIFISIHTKYLEKYI